MNFKRKLPVPKEIKEQYPLTEELSKIKEARDIEIADIFTGKSSKMVLVIGPCSADREDAVLDYCTRLAKLQDKVKDKLVLIPRVYTNKPRTTGAGYKGLLHQPDPEKHEDMLEGVIAIRRLHTNVLAQTGLSTADEMLYPDNYRYLSDLLSYVAVGARSVENQEHRLTASGIDIPVGMKNPTSGDISVMLNSIMAAQGSHTFIYRGWEVETTGNELTHAILRGYVNRHGEAIPNYHYEELESLYKAYVDKNLKNLALVVDANHSNSAKKYEEQPRICKEVLHSCRHSAHIKSMVKGFMIESYLEGGSQKIGEGVYGKSITDPCIGWDDTYRLVCDIAELI
ncbi:MAG: 3-deoxy-7-phosphoheptulonate synthase [Oscillospiraceae bacterium]|nr:3-deoxy-7-phosphoheptulonate synthase [Oscillospiraceae bacterium]